MSVSRHVTETAIYINMWSILQLYFSNSDGDIEVKDTACFKEVISWSFEIQERGVDNIYENITSWTWNIFPSPNKDIYIQYEDINGW